MGPEVIAGMLAELQDNGMVVQADTLEELAEKLQLPAENFVATIERYNELAAAGHDEDFGKPEKDLIALTTPPSFGCTSGAWMLCTLDGLIIKTDAQVLDANNEAIEGLYATGNASGAFFAHNYPELFVGVASGRGATMARHGVLHALGAL